MKKLIVTLNLALVFVFLVASVAFAAAPLQEEEEAGPISIGVSFPQQENIVWTSSKAFMEEYAEEYGKLIGRPIELTITVAAADPNRQAADVEDLISRGVDVILVSPMDATAIGASIKAAHEAGIPIATFLRPAAPDVEQPDANIGLEPVLQAYTTGLCLAEVLAEDGIEGKCINVQGDLVDENAVLRDKGWNMAKDETGAWEDAVTIPAEWLPEKALTGVTNALQANPDANCMFVASDHYIASIQTALEQADRWKPRGEEGHMYIGSQDIFTEAIEMMKDGYIDCNTELAVFDIAKQSIEVAVMLANGKWDFQFPGRVGTPDNIEDMPNLWSRELTEK